MRHERHDNPLGRRTVVLAWAAVLLGVCGWQALLPRRGDTLRQAVAGRGVGVYPIYATAGRDWYAGRDLYHAEVGESYYRYSPTVAALLVPFGALPDRAGAVLWRLLNAAVLLAGVAGCVPLLPRLGNVSLFSLLLLPLCVGNLHAGQSNVLILGLLLASVAAAARERWTLASGCVVLACLFKVYPVALGLLLVLLYPRPLAWRFLLLLAAGLGLPFLTQPPGYVAEQYALWWGHLTTSGRDHLAPEYGYRDLRTLCRWVSLPLSGTAYHVVQLGAAAVAAALVLANRFQERALALLFHLAGCWMTLVGPASESATYILLAPTACACLLRAWTEPRSLPLALPWTCGYALLLAAQLANWYPGGGRAFQALGPQPLGALFLFVGLAGEEVVRLSRRGRMRLPRDGHRVLTGESSHEPTGYAVYRCENQAAAVDAHQAVAPVPRDSGE